MDTMIEVLQSAINLYLHEVNTEAASKEETFEEQKALSNATTMSGITVKGAFYILHNGDYYPAIDGYLDD